MLRIRLVVRPSQQLQSHSLQIRSGCTHRHPGLKGYSMADDLFPLGKDNTPYRKLTSDFVKVERFRDQEVLVVEEEGLRMLSEAAFIDINHLLRPGHLK